MVEVCVHIDALPALTLKNSSGRALDWVQGPDINKSLVHQAIEVFEHNILLLRHPGEGDFNFLGCLCGLQAED